MATVVWPYKMGSASAKALAAALDVKRVRTNGRYRPRPGATVINWGNARLPTWPYANGVTMLNFPQAVNIAGNKLLALQCMEQAGVRVPIYTVTKEAMIVALGKFKPVVSRHILRGTSGAGAVYFDSEQEFMASPVAPLYVEYIKKTDEYRVHVVRGEVIDYAVKRKRRGVEHETKIRNLQGGWVFCRDGIVLPDDVAAEAVKAVAALGLDFGAVDVIYNQVRGVYVLEVNTAPGLEGRTIRSYAEAFHV